MKDQISESRLDTDYNPQMIVIAENIVIKRGRSD